MKSKKGTNSHIITRNDFNIQRTASLILFLTLHKYIILMNRYLNTASQREITIKNK